MRAQTETQTSKLSVTTLPYILVFVASTGKRFGHSVLVASLQRRGEIKFVFQYLPLVCTGL